MGKQQITQKTQVSRIPNWITNWNFFQFCTAVLIFIFGGPAILAIPFVKLGEKIVRWLS